VLGYLKANLQAALEYRVGFASQVLSMLVNDLMWLTFWLAYFSRFPLVQGWGREQVATMWAVVAAGFGVGVTVAGNANFLAGLIARGQMDFYLALPRPVLPHALVSRMELTAPGDVLFGLLVFGVVAHPGAAQWALFAVLVLTTALIIVSFTVMAHSLAFWLGDAESLAMELWGALISFSTYPTVIFRGPVRVLLFTVLPAGFIAYVPVELLRRFSWPLMGAVVGFSALMVAASTAVFRAGLKRYESGNLLAGRQ
jgi:ABC-2 type transport system permease protein